MDKPILRHQKTIKTHKEFLIALWSIKYKKAYYLLKKWINKMKRFESLYDTMEENFESPNSEVLDMWAGAFI